VVDDLKIIKALDCY